MNSRELRFIKIALLILALICTASILYNLTKEDPHTTNFETIKKFSMTISEDKWDESMMPKGRRSPKGVLYNPEK